MQFTARSFALSNSKKASYIKAAVCSQILSLPRDISAKCGDRLLRKHIQIQPLTIPHRNPEVGRFGDKRAERETFGLGRRARSAEVCTGVPAVIGLLCALQVEGDCCSGKDWRRERNSERTFSTDLKHRTASLLAESSVAKSPCHPTGCWAAKRFASARSHSQNTADFRCGRLRRKAT